MAGTCFMYDRTNSNAFNIFTRKNFLEKFLLLNCLKISINTFVNQAFATHYQYSDKSICIDAQYGELNFKNSRRKFQNQRKKDMP